MMKKMVLMVLLLLMVNPISAKVTIEERLELHKDKLDPTSILWVEIHKEGDEIILHKTEVMYSLKNATKRYGGRYSAYPFNVKGEVLFGTDFDLKKLTCYKDYSYKDKETGETIRHSFDDSCYGDYKDSFAIPNFYDIDHLLIIDKRGRDVVANLSLFSHNKCDYSGVCDVTENHRTCPEDCEEEENEQMVPASSTPKKWLYLFAGFALVLLALGIYFFKRPKMVQTPFGKIEME